MQLQKLNHYLNKKRKNNEFVQYPLGIFLSYFLPTDFSEFRSSYIYIYVYLFLLKYDYVAIFMPS